MPAVKTNAEIDKVSIIRCDLGLDERVQNPFEIVVQIGPRAFAGDEYICPPIHFTATDAGLLAELFRRQIFPVATLF